MILTLVPCLYSHFVSVHLKYSTHLSPQFFCFHKYVLCSVHYSKTVAMIDVDHASEHMNFTSMLPSNSPFSSLQPLQNRPIIFALVKHIILDDYKSNRCSRASHVSGREISSIFDQYLDSKMKKTPPPGYVASGLQFVRLGRRCGGRNIGWMFRFEGSS